MPRLKNATTILRAVLHAIVNGLERDGRVYIRGFGTFKIVERTHRPTPNNILANDRQGKPMVYAQGLLYYKPRRVVIFEPSLPFAAMLNPNSPNYKERRAQRCWNNAPSEVL